MTGASTTTATFMPGLGFHRTGTAPEETKSKHFKGSLRLSSLSASFRRRFLPHDQSQSPPSSVDSPLLSDAKTILVAAVDASKTSSILDAAVNNSANKPTRSASTQFKPLGARNWHRLSIQENAFQRLMRKYGELAGRIFVIEIPISIFNHLGHQQLDRSVQLGLGLAGNKDFNRMNCFICGIKPESIAQKDGRLQVGDQILEVNDQVLYGRSHLNAAPLIRSAYMDALDSSGGGGIFRRAKVKSLRMVIQRFEGNLGEMALNNSYGSQFSETYGRRLSEDTVEMSLDDALSCQSRQSVANETAGMIASPSHKKQRRSSSVVNVGGGRLAYENVYACSLIRASQGFGFAIMEGSFTNEPGIYVKHIVIDGPAAREGTLKPGDRILRVGWHDAVDASYDQVLGWLLTAKYELKLVVSRWRCDDREVVEEIRPVGHAEYLAKKRLSAPHLVVLNSFAKNFASASTSPSRRLSAIAIKGPDTIALPVATPGGGGANNILNKALQFLALPTVATDPRRASSPEVSLPGFGSGKERKNILDKYAVQAFPLASAEKRSNFQFLSQLPFLRALRSRSGSRVNGEIAIDEDQLILKDPPKPQEPPISRLIVAGEETEIEFPIGDSLGLGATLIGGQETALNELMISEIAVDGLVAKDGRLRCGDHIVKINGQSVQGLPYYKALELITSAWHGPATSTANGMINKPAIAITSSALNLAAMSPATMAGHMLNLLVKRPATNPEKWYDHEVTVELSKKASKGLGICIEARSIAPWSGEEARSLDGKHVEFDCHGVSVSDLVRGSPAAADGRIHVGDQIMEINNFVVTSLCQLDCAVLMNASPNKVVLKLGRLKGQLPPRNSAQALVTEPLLVANKSHATSPAPPVKAK